MSSKTYGVDVASYQPADVSSYHSNGASFCIVKLTQGTGYTNPRSAAQVQSSRSGHMYTHAYHYAEFGSSVSQAKKEAAYFLKVAQSSEIKISKKRYLWLDWESGSGNVTSGSKSANTEAILAFMSEIKEAGYKTGLYSGASLLKTAIDTSQVVEKFGNCLWVASYPVAGASSTANFGYFPSMNGVAVWQFTDNWRGLGVDGNISVIDLQPDADETAQPAKPVTKPTAKTWKDSSGYTWQAKTGAFTTSTVINLRTGASTSSAIIAALPAGSKVKFDAMSTHGGYTWLRQPRSHGYGYLACRSTSGDKYGKIE